MNAVNRRRQEDPMAIATFSTTGAVDAPVTIKTGHDVATDFGCASGPAICPPEIDYPVTTFRIAVEFPFPIWLLDTRLEKNVLSLGLDRLGADDDWAELAVVLDYPYDGAAEMRVEAERGRKVELQVTLTGGEPCGGTGAAYERVGRW